MPAKERRRVKYLPPGWTAQKAAGVWMLVPKGFDHEANMRFAISV